jgi:hypothetical protein
MLVEREGSNPLIAVIDATPLPAEPGEAGSLRIRLLRLDDHHTAPPTILIAPSECEQLIEIAKTVMANAAAEKLRQSQEPLPAPVGTALPSQILNPGMMPFPGVPGPKSSQPPPTSWPRNKIGGG